MPSVGPDPELLTVRRAAALLSVSVYTIRRWTSEGKVPHVRLPGGNHDRRIPRAALLASLGGDYDLAGELAKQEAASEKTPEE
jgi:excisionase family DNA binding protein